MIYIPPPPPPPPPPPDVSNTENSTEQEGCRPSSYILFVHSNILDCDNIHLRCHNISLNLKTQSCYDPLWYSAVSSYLICFCRIRHEKWKCFQKYGTPSPIFHSRYQWRYGSLAIALSDPCFYSVVFMCSNILEYPFAPSIIITCVYM